MTANQTDQSMRSQPPAGASEPEPFADREARNPYFRWLVHLGLPMAISLLLHVTLFGVFALKTWQAFTERTIEVGEYEAGITESLADQMEGAFKWPGETLLQAPNPDAFDFAANESFTRDLSELGELDLGETGSGGEALDTGGFGIGTSGRSGILGLGGGAGSGGGGGIGGGFGTGTGIGKAGVWNLRIQANKIACTPCRPSNAPWPSSRMRSSSSPTATSTTRWSPTSPRPTAASRPRSTAWSSTRSSSKIPAGCHA